MVFSLKVTHKLFLSFFLIALLVGGLGYLAFVTGAWVEDGTEALDAAALETIATASEMSRTAQATQAAMHEVVAEGMRGSAEESDPVAETAPDTMAQEALAAQLAVFERHLGRSLEASRGSDRLREVEQAFAVYAEMAEHFGELSTSAPAEAAALYDAEIEPFYLEKLSPLLDQHIADVEAAIAERTEKVSTAARWSGRIGLGAAVLVLLVVVALGFFLIRFIALSLSALTDAAQAIGEGRLDDRVDIDSRDEIGLLGQAINGMIDQLSSTTVSKSYVENIVQSMADPLVVVDPHVKIAMVNQAALDLLGYERRDLLGRPVMTIFAHGGRGRGAAIKQTIEQALAGNVETGFQDRKGREIPVSLSSALVREDDDVLGLVIVAKDITVQKQFETELIEAKEKAEQMVHLRDAFLANMSHEIRTPLTGILGSAQVLAEGLEGDHRNLAQIIEDAGTRLLDTINSVLEMARIEAGEVQPEVEILNLFEEAEASASVLKHVADKRGLQLRVQPVGTPVYAQIDRSCLHRILNNLIGNAIKFTREGAISVEIESTKDDAVLTVRDTGVGISKQFLPHLFDDFKQESTGLKRSHEGSGLGLAITKKLVEMMGGTISVESIKGIGSAFSVTFPRVPVEQLPDLLSDAGPAATPKPAAPAPKPAASASPRYPWESEASSTDEPTFASPPAPGERPQRDLLLIEDNAQNAYMARFMLEGYATDIATSPEEAIEQAHHHQYRLLLVDINLGADRSGIDLLHEIRGVEGYELVPAVAVTAYALPGDEDRFLNEGFDDYVAKPFRKEVLLASVEKALAKAEEEDTTPKLETIFDDTVFDGSFDDADTLLFDANLPGLESEPVPAESDDDPHDLASNGAGRPTHPAGG